MDTNLVWYFLSVKGRVSRQEYWLGWAAAFVLLLPLNRMLELLSVYVRRPAGRTWWYRDELELAYALPKVVLVWMLVWPITAIFVKRLHDLNQSGWWLLLLTAMWMAGAVAHIDHWKIVFPAIILVIGLIPGTRGGNQFGADPVAHKRTAQKP